VGAKRSLQLDSPGKTPIQFAQEYMAKRQVYWLIKAQKRANGLV